MANTDLHTARSGKKDEFYTQWGDIEREMNAYLEFDPDVFRDKTVLLPCDDPKWSNFTKFFALHFEDFGLKKLISTSYAPKSNTAFDSLQPALFAVDDPYDAADAQYDETQAWENGRVFVLERKDISGDGAIDIDDLQWTYLQGDGDFRSEEVTRLRDEADVVITNPPFSLFRSFVHWVLDGDVEFSIIGTINAVTYKEVFPLIRSNQIWLGPTISSGDREFGVPKSYPLRAAGCRVDENGNKFVNVKGVRWFTNIEHGRRHEPMKLLSMADNRRFSRRKQIIEGGYPEYDNYDAIDVAFSEAIPSDFSGMMGVPITFLDRYSPEQFEVLGISQSWDDPSGLKTRIYPKQTQIKSSGETSTVTKLNDGAAIAVSEAPAVTHYKVGEQLYIKPYVRIFIRHRQQEGS